ncbi:MAG TPA: acetoacetate decarboxylase family protein [Candidatus Binataceae bacterium]|nr:acetoacetate decarboxylase family protein [Candidatus Binataceae bacterium]
MPDFGRAKHEKYAIDPPSAKPEYPALPWTCADATMLNVYFEVRKEILLDWLPPEYGRTSPAYCRLIVADVTQSPIGPFRDATLALGCRLNMMPAGFAVASITNSRSALAAGIAERGIPNIFGKIEFESDRNRAHAVISDEKGQLVEVILPLLQTIEPSRLAYDHVDAIKTSRGDNGMKTDLVVTSPEFKIEHAAICKNARIEYPSERPESAWQILNNRNVVSAQVVRGIRTFAAAQPPR